MKRTQIVDEADKWLMTNPKKRSALAVLVTDEEQWSSANLSRHGWQLADDDDCCLLADGRETRICHCYGGGN